MHTAQFNSLWQITVNELQQLLGWRNKTENNMTVMTLYRTRAHITISVLLFLATGICHAQVQSSRDLSRQQEIESRLKAIYDRGEFRAKKFQAQWLKDSSGYIVQEHDPKTDKIISAPTMLAQANVQSRSPTMKSKLRVRRWFRPMNQKCSSFRIGIYSSAIGLADGILS